MAQRLPASFLSMTPETTYKPHGNSVLEALPFAQRARIAWWLGRENRTYDETRRLVAQEFGLATSTSALRRYYRRWIAERKRGRARGRAGSEFRVPSSGLVGPKAEGARPKWSPPPAGARRPVLADLRRLACLVGDDPRKVDAMAAELEELRVKLLKVRADLARSGPKASGAARGRAGSEFRVSGSGLVGPKTEGARERAVSEIGGPGAGLDGRKDPAETGR